MLYSSHIHSSLNAKLCSETFFVAAEEAKAVREGDEVLREMSRSPSVQKERSEQEPPEKGPTPQCRPFPHKALEVCDRSRCSPGHACVCITLSTLAPSC